MSYFVHEATPYPLADFEGDFPNNLLVDISLTVAADYRDTARITALKVTRAYAFISIETDTVPLAYVYVTNPRAGKLYRFDQGEGWVVFGTGLGKDYEMPAGTEAFLDPKCLIIETPDVPEFSLLINGVAYAMPDTLRFIADGYIKLEVYDRDVALDLYVPPSPEPGQSAGSSESSGQSEAPAPPIPSEEVPSIVISRNDDKIDESILTRGLISYPLPPVRTFGGSSPDAQGNIDIVVQLESSLLEDESYVAPCTGTEVEDPIKDGGVYVIPCDKADIAGFVLWTLGVKGCPEDNLIKQLKFSDCGDGKSYELPFDRILQRFKKSETPCGPEPLACTTPGSGGGGSGGSGG